MSLCRRTVIEIISPIDKTLPYNYDTNISSATQVYVRWDEVAPGVACPYIKHFDESSFNCSSISDHILGQGSVGELFIVVNFTSAFQAEKNVGFENDPPRGARIFMIKLRRESGYIPRTNDPHAWGYPFPLLPNVHLWATLSMTTEQFITNENSAALGIPKVGCDAQSPTSLIMFLVSNFAYIQYR